ncbi:unnamed protein product, partial [Iphiclides podalirius]
MPPLLRKGKFRKENTPNAGDVAALVRRLRAASTNRIGRLLGSANRAEGGRLRAHDKKSHDWLSVGSRPKDAASRAAHTEHERAAPAQSTESRAKQRSRPLPIRRNACKAGTPQATYTDLTW